MLNQQSIKTVAALRFGPGLYRPAYGSYCFAHLPDTILKAFGLPAAAPLPTDVLPADGRFDRVVLFLIDAFGWHLLERYADRAPFLREMLAGGVVSQLTSMFPSSTAPHVTCMHTGLAVSASRIPEWFYFEPQLDAVIAPLLFAYAGENKSETLAAQGIAPEMIFPAPNLYLPLQQTGVKSYVFGHRDYANSSFSSVVTRGAETVAYQTWPESLTSLQIRMKAERGQAYFCLYFGEVDSVLHRYGPGSRQAEAEISCLMGQMDGFLRGCKHRGRTLILLTADHGQMAVEPGSTVYLNQRFPGLEHVLKVDRQGQSILFAGSPRDLYLHVREEQLEETYGLLREGLAGSAAVYLTQELVQLGLFGPSTDAPELIFRLGNLAILPKHGESVFWFVKDRFEQRFFGHHGGLAEEEMLIPLLAYEV